MKKFLVATILTIATTTAFGAASLRTTKVGSGATATPITAPGRARAGTLRSQPTKMISSTSVTPATQKTVATPAAQTSTNARLSLLKAPGNLSIKDIKDTGAVNQQFANIDSRIDNIEENIGDMVSAQTYTKSEIDEMLRAITPTIDDNGYLNIPTAGGGSVRQNYMWLVGSDESFMPIARVDWYAFDPSLVPEETVDEEISHMCNHFINHLACCRGPIDSVHHEFDLHQTYHGYKVNSEETVTRNGRTFVKLSVVTAEPDPSTYIHDVMCRNRPAEDCWTEIVGAASSCVNGEDRYTYLLVYYAISDPEQPPYHLVSSAWMHGDLEYNETYELQIPGSVTEIPSEWINSICANYHSPSDFIRCYESPLDHPINLTFTIRKEYPGFYLESTEAIDNGVRYNYVTHQQELTESDLREHFCGNQPTSSCYLSQYYDTCEVVSPTNFWYRNFSVDILTALPGYFVTGIDETDISVNTHYASFGQPSHATMQDWVENNICPATPAEQSSNMMGCCYQECNSGSSNTTCFNAYRMFHGYEVISSEVVSQPTVLNHQHVMFNVKLVRTFENDSQNYIHRELCGNRPATDCWVERESSIDTCDNRITEHRYYVYSRITPPASYESTGVDTDEISTVTHYISSLNPTNSAIQTWVNNICAATPASQATNMLGCCWEQCESGEDAPTCFDVRRMYSGYKIVSSKIITRNNQLVLDQEIETYEDDAETDLLDEFCNGRPSSECWVYHVTGDEIATCDSRIKRYTHHVQSVFEYYLHNVGEEPTIDGLGRKITIRTNAPDNMLKLYSDYWCANRGDFWCKTFTEDIPNSTDRLFIIRIRHHGVKCLTDHMSTVGTYMQCATNENNTTESYTLDYVNSKICGAAVGTDTCYVTHITDVFNGHPENFENNQEPVTRYEVSLFKSMVEEEKPPVRLEK